MPDPLPTHPPPLFSRDEWRRRLALWVGAVLVALAAIAFTKASNSASAGLRGLFAQSQWWALLVTPSVFALLAWATTGVLWVTRVRGIPQAVPALKVRDETFRKSELRP